MKTEDLESIESETGVTFSIGDSGALIAAGADDAIDAAVKQIGDGMAAAVTLCRARQGLNETTVTRREIPTNVPSLATQRVSYRAWTLQRSGYYQPSTEELDRMFAVLEEGDLVIPDFALSFSVRRKNGTVIQVDRRGRVTPPSPYSPALKG